MAYQRFEDETSSSTGVPLWISRTTDPAIGFMVEERMDQADRALAEWDKKNSGKKKKEGVSRSVVVVDVTTGQPLDFGGQTRDQFYEDAKALVEGSPELDDDLIQYARPEKGYDPSEYGDAE